MKSILSVGMDVHKNSFSLCAYDGYTGEIVAESTFTSDVKLVVKFIDKLKNRYENDVEIQCGYEAGCLGYSLYKSLIARGIDCVILAPTTMQISAKNKVVKNDRMDALNIAKNLASGSYKAVYVPDEEDVNTKEYIRMIHDFKKELKRIKQEICALLLRHGYQYDGKAKWTIRYMKWIRELEMSKIQRETLNEYLAEMDNLNDKIERFMDRVDEMYQSDRYKEKVSELRCIKGIDTFAAMTIQVETSDFDRFPNAKAYASYTGLTTGEHSSGDKNNRIGITKQGNTAIRKILVECAQALVKGSVYAPKSKRLKGRQKGMNVDIIAYADKATERLMKKYQKLIDRNLPKNKAIVAVARELACFIWGMETGNIH